jgi:hypothetical protein
MKTKNVFLFGLALLLAACGVEGSISTSQENINETVVEIADFDLPAGFVPELSTTLLGYQAVAYSRGDGPGHIYLIQSSDPADADRLAQALDEIVIGSGDPTTRLTVVETRSVVVRGQETTLVISEAVNSEGHTYRQAAVGFQGNGGPALLVFSESIEHWDENILKNLISSLR